MSTQNRANDQVTVIDAIENHFRADIREIATRLRTEIEAAGISGVRKTGWTEFLFHRQFEPIVNEQTVPILEQGNTRPIIYPKVAVMESSRTIPPRFAPRTVLLYAPDAILVDPFDQYIVNGGVEFILSTLEGVKRMSGWELEATCENLPPHEWLARTVEYLADVAPAVRDGVLRMVSVRFAITRETQYQLNDSDVERIRGMGLEKNTLNMTRVAMYALAQIHALKTVRGAATPLVELPTDQQLLSRFIKREITNQRKKKKKSLIPGQMFDAWQEASGKSHISGDINILRNLASLELPGVDDIKMTDLLDVRGDAVFDDIRTDIRHALIQAEEQRKFSDAQEVAQEYFRASAARISTMRSPALRDLLIPKAVSWGVGATIAWHAGTWQLLLPLVFEATAEKIIDEKKGGKSIKTSGKARRSQQALYVQLGKVSTD